MRIINRWRLGVLALAFCAPTSARALDLECGDVAAIIRQAYPGAVAQGGRAVRVGDRMITLPSASSIDPHGVVCRRWRGQPGLRLVAVPLIAQVRSDGTSGDLDVLVVNETTGTPHQRLRLPHAMDDGAIHLSGVSFDTAAYRIGPDRLAFGVRRVTRSPPAAPESEKCGTTDRAETPRTISLRFDGERYVVPRPLKRD